MSISRTFEMPIKYHRIMLQPEAEYEHQIKRIATFEASRRDSYKVIEGKSTGDVEQQYMVLITSR